MEREGLKICIAIAKPAGMAITKKILKQCFDNNPDGAGFCIEIDGKLVINKGYFTFEDFYDAYLPYEELKALIHFRIRTHGQTDAENCHPFFITDNVAFIHNGIISDVPHHNDKSDTRMFKEQYLLPIVQNYGQQALTSPIISRLIEKFIGGSKFVFMIKGQEDFTIYNKSMGNLSKEQIWFSNYSWQVPTYVVTPPIPYQHKKKSTQVQLETNGYSETSPGKGEKNKVLSVEKLEIPVLEQGTKMFSFGTSVVVKWPINTEFGTIPKGAVGEIEKVYSNRTVDVDFLMEGKITNLYPYALEIIDDLPLEIWDNSQSLHLYHGEL